VSKICFGSTDESSQCLHSACGHVLNHLTHYLNKKRSDGKEGEEDSEHEGNCTTHCYKG
jgi:hypothetical protein